jgi:hypothetical protein
MVSEIGGTVVEGVSVEAGCGVGCMELVAGTWDWAVVVYDLVLV